MVNKLKVVVKAKETSTDGGGYC